MNEMNLARNEIDRLNAEIDRLRKENEQYKTVFSQFAIALTLGDRLLTNLLKPQDLPHDFNG